MSKRQKTVCAECGKDSGRFTFRGNRWLCQDCLRGPRMRDGTHKNWPLVTMNLSDDPNQGPIVVQNLRHLRQLENKYGVASHVYNENQSNIVEHNRK